MKNKSRQSNINGQQKVLNTPNPSKNLKNRNHIQKKLKELIEKQERPPVKAVPNLHYKANKASNLKPKSSQNGNEVSMKQESVKAPQTKNSNLNMEPECAQSVSPKSNILKKNKKVTNSNGVNLKGNDIALKRKLNEKKEPPKKSAKNTEHSKASDNKLQTKKQKLVNGKPDARKTAQPSKKKTDKGKVKETTGDRKKTKLSPTKTALSQKKPKVQLYVQGRGPLRPLPTSESEFDADVDSSPCQETSQSEQRLSTESEIDLSPKTEQKVPSTEQALMRAKNEFEDSGSDDNHVDNSYLDFLFNNTCVDSDETTSFSGESENEYTEGEEESEFECSEESDLDYASESCEEESSHNYDESSANEYWDEYSSDESYKPPENLPEDVYIAQGTAVKYELTNNDVSFDSDEEYAQLIEIPTPHAPREKTSPKKTLPLPTKPDEITSLDDEVPMSDSDDSSCPELVPIDSTSFYSSSSESSHSCFSDCSCGSSSDYDVDTTSSQQKYEPMTPEIITAKGHVVDEMDTFFNTKSSDYETKDSSRSLLEEIEVSNYNPMQFKVYTINNEILNNDSFSSDKPAQLEVNSENSSSAAIQNVSETQHKIINKITHVTNQITPEATSRDKQPPGKVIATAEKSSPLTLSNDDQPPQKVISISEKLIPVTTSHDEQLFQKIISTAEISIPVTPSQDKQLSLNNISTSEKPSPITPSRNEQPFQKTIAKTEIPSPFNSKGKTYNAKPSEPKVQIRTLFFNAINCNHVIVLLKDPLYIYGTVKLKLLAGCLKIFGYNPKRNEVLEIFSPRGYSSLKIEPSHSNESGAPLNEKELLSLTPFFIRSDLDEILRKFDPAKDAILILERNDRSKKVNMLRKYMVEHLFPNMNAMLSDRPFYTSEFLLRCIITPFTENPLIINPDWNSIRVENNSKIMIIGGKSVGKSTLLRYLINKNLNEHTKMLLIDLDIGQPEMFVPQTISATTLTEPLLGPGYFLNKQPDKSFLVGHFSIMNSLEAYIASLKALFEFCNENNDYKDIPWLVNTMGYNKGFGDELISVICSLLQPSNIVQFESNREIDDFDMIMLKDNVKSIERNVVGEMFPPSDEFNPQHQLTLIKSFIPKSRNLNSGWAMKPRDMRLAMILSRLSSILVGHAEWMTDVKPLCASIDDLKIIKMGDDQLCKEDLVKTLVGNLVYLCRMESGKAYECFGLGIVRGIDFPLRQIYLLPTTSHSILTTVDCLVICGIPLPSSILLNQGPKVKGVASYVYNTLDDSASMYIKQMYKPQSYTTGNKRRYNQ